MTLVAFRKQLKTITRFTRLVDSKTFKETGSGEVLITHPSESEIFFQEKGLWHASQLNFTNTFRWTFDLKANRVSLEHLRLGAGQPVFLFYLSPQTDRLLVPDSPHLCNKDCYLLTVTHDPFNIELNWSIAGPKKDEKIFCRYTSSLLTNTPC
jgi:hypothetical protein